MLAAIVGLVTLIYLAISGGRQAQTKLVRKQQLGESPRTREQKIEAFKLCERCERFYSFELNACPYQKPHSTHCPLFSEVKKERKDDFLREVYEIMLENPRKVQSRPDSQMKHLRNRIREENKYIQWGWRFWPRCYSTDWEPVYANRIRCKNCSKIFT